MKSRKQTLEQTHKAVGLGEGPTNPAHEGPYNDPMEVAEHDNEYAESATAVGMGGTADEFPVKPKGKK